MSSPGIVHRSPNQITHGLRGILITTCGARKPLEQCGRGRKIGVGIRGLLRFSGLER